MLFADILLARRVEAAEAAIARGCAPSGAAVLEIAGGCAVFVGPDSPLTQAAGIGLNGPVGDAQADALEAFFRSRGSPVRMDLCPLADPGLLETLSARGYRVTEFNNVLVRRLAGFEPSAAPRVRRISESEPDLWSCTVGRGFFEAASLTEDEMNVGRGIAAMPGAACYLGLEAGEPAAGGAMATHFGLATLFADSTIAAFRRRGLHRELVLARLNDAVAAGCDLAAASSLPGSPSQRTYERLGFEVAYTRVTLIS